MSVATFLADLRRRDIRVWTDGDRLHCDAPSGALTSELREQLRTRKDDVLEFLRASQSLARQERAIVPLQHRGERTPMFAVPGHNGDVFCYRALAQSLGESRPFFGLEPPGLDGFEEPLTSIEELADYFAGQILAFRPDRPIMLGGYCAGGTVAFELARQLQQRGAKVEYLALFGSPYPSWYRWTGQLRWRFGQQVERGVKHARALTGRSLAGCRDYVTEKMKGRRARIEAEAEAAPVLDAVLMRRAAVERATLKAARVYVPAPYAGRMGLFLPSGDAALEDGARRWKAVAWRAEECLSPSDADGFNMLREPHAPAVAELLRRSLDAIEDAQ